MASGQPLGPPSVPGKSLGDGSGAKRRRSSRRDKKESREPPEKKIKPAPPFPYGKLIEPDTFEAEDHFYPKVLNAHCHPMVSSFMRLENERIILRYCHLYPQVNPDFLRTLLSTPPTYFKWAGADLFNVTNHRGQRQMIVIETNSCPSGQKSMPPLSDDYDADGYHVMMKTTFWPQVQAKAAKGELPEGKLAVIYDKNDMEASGYAAALADVSREPVLLATFYITEKDPPIRWKDGVMQIRDDEGAWHPIRACFRYLTNKPWNRLPLHTKTYLLNPTLCCLAGGRNKMAADKAYELLNLEIADSGLHLRTPQTQRDVQKQAVPLWVKTMGGKAVVKVPYANAGMGVYTITSQGELDAFMEEKHSYDKFIVQSLVGNSTWSSLGKSGQYFHTGTIPDRKQKIYASDLRMMVVGTPEGWRPVAIYARRARKPLTTALKAGADSWDMLGTNLSIRRSDGKWDTDTARLMLMDMKDFNRMGLAVDDLIDGYIQTILASVAIDRFACQFVDKDGKFKLDLYRTLNDDKALLNEILIDATEQEQFRPTDPMTSKGSQGIKPRSLEGEEGAKDKEKDSDKDKDIPDNRRSDG